MNVCLQCRACSHSWQMQDEPRQLTPLTCPRCQNMAALAASEDFASALEDLLVQLHALGKTHAVAVHLSTEAIPLSFVPRADDLDVPR